MVGGREPILSIGKSILNLSVRGEHGSHQKRICPVRLKRGFLVLLISACIRRVPRMVIALSFNLPESPSWHSSSSFPDTHSTPGPRQSRSLTSPLDYPAGKEWWPQWGRERCSGLRRQGPPPARQSTVKPYQCFDVNDHQVKTPLSQFFLFLAIKFLIRTYVLQSIINRDHALCH